jgi:hypothetical protein
MTIEKQKEFILVVAKEFNLTSKVIEMLFLLVDENSFWRRKGYNALRLAFKKLVTYTEQEQIEFIERAIIGHYRGLVWSKKQQPKQEISRTEQIHNLFRQ